MGTTKAGAVISDLAGKQQDRRAFRGGAKFDETGKTDEVRMRLLGRTPTGDYGGTRRINPFKNRYGYKRLRGTDDWDEEEAFNWEPDDDEEELWRGLGNSGFDAEMEDIPIPSKKNKK